MIQVTTTYPYRVYEIDADGAAILAPSKADDVHELVLLKGDDEVAWFRNWSSAVNVANLNSASDLVIGKDDLGDL